MGAKKKQKDGEKPGGKQGLTLKAGSGKRARYNAKVGYTPGSNPRRVHGRWTGGPRARKKS